MNATYLHTPFKRLILLQSAADLPAYRVRGMGIETHQRVDTISEGTGDDVARQIRYALKIGKYYGHQRLDQPDTLVLTSYQTLRDYQFSLCAVDWTVAVFDEAQNIKNPNVVV